MSNPIVPAAAVEADPKRPYKAYVAALAAALAAFVGYWIGDEDPFTMKDAGEGFLLALGASGLSGVPTYFARNPKVVDGNPPRPIDEVGAASLPLVLVVLGVVLAILALLVADLAFLLWVGIILAVVGVVLMLAGSSPSRR